MRYVYIVLHTIIITIICVNTSQVSGAAPSSVSASMPPIPQQSTTFVSRAKQTTGFSIKLGRVAHAKQPKDSPKQATLAHAESCTKPATGAKHPTGSSTKPATKQPDSPTTPATVSGAKRPKDTTEPVTVDHTEKTVSPTTPASVRCATGKKRILVMAEVRVFPCHRIPTTEEGGDKILTPVPEPAAT